MDSARTRRSRRTSRSVGYLGAVVAVLLAAACGDDGGGNSAEGGDEPQPTTTAGETTTTATPDEGTTTTTPPEEDSSAGAEEYDSVEDEIVARYIAFWDARFAANSPPDPDHPDLAEYACCDQLEHVRSETEGHQDSGLEFRPADDPADRRWVEVVSHEGNEATVQECVVVDTVVVDSASGDVISDDVATYSVRGEMRRVDGEWRLASATEVQSWEGKAGCIDAQ